MKNWKSFDEIEYNICSKRVQEYQRVIYTIDFGISIKIGFINILEERVMEEYDIMRTGQDFSKLKIIEWHFNFFIELILKES